jgi:hypothetical protein
LPSAFWYRDANCFRHVKIANAELRADPALLNGGWIESLSASARGSASRVSSIVSESVSVSASVSGRRVSTSVSVIASGAFVLVSASVSASGGTTSIGRRGVASDDREQPLALV